MRSPTALAKSLLSLLLCLGLTCCTQGHGEPAGPPRSTMEMQTADFFMPNYRHLMPHPVAHLFGEDNRWGDFFNVNAYQLWVVLAIGVLFLIVHLASGATTGRSPWFVRVLRGWCHWLRDEVVYNLMGKEEGDKWAPFFIYLFFFIAGMNMVGLVPYGVTATATANVTGALAAVILVLIVGGGMIRQGPMAFWRHLLPPGLPWLLVPLMAVIEVIGLFVKPFALMIRLFANMLAGHLLIYSFIGLVFVFAQMMHLSAASYLTAAGAVAMAVFIMIIEALVVLLQAYIFVYLSVLFVQQALHPEH